MAVGLGGAAGQLLHVSAQIGGRQNSVDQAQAQGLLVVEWLTEQAAGRAVNGRANVQ